MIRKLKIRFIILSMTSLFVLLAVIVAGMNIINYNSVVGDADEVLSLLSQNRGAFPEFGADKGHPLPPDMSPELPYESRYFSVLLSSSNDVVHTETSRITAVDASTAINYALSVAKGNAKNGFVDQFRFSKTYEGSGIRITFLDCGRKLDSFYRFLFVSSGIALAGFIIVFFVIFFFAGRIIRPIAESYEKQKRFITDAGHEIKTPLTIINANVDVLQMDIGSNECLEDIQLQTKRLTALTNDLVMLARMEEGQASMQMIDFPVSEVIADAAMPFRALAYTQNKELICDIEPMLSISGNAKAIEQLISILMDNALKYSPAGESILLKLKKTARNLHLTVSNATKAEISHENLSLVFDRFYRTDASRNSETGGHGIGLSVARAIVIAHGGKIQASSPDPHTFKITVIIPM